jgi:O-6-methylguanine DNA methyltransferase
VYEIVRGIPRGKVLSYKEVARLADRPKAWRAVGNILKKNKVSKIPCHRVIRSNNEVGGYRYGVNKKTSLLKKEGVIIKRRRVSYFQKERRYDGRKLADVRSV